MVFRDRWWCGGWGGEENIQVLWAAIGEENKKLLWLSLNSFKWGLEGWRVGWGGVEGAIKMIHKRVRRHIVGGEGG